MSNSIESDPRSYPDRPLLAASAAVFRDGKVLLARRAAAPAAGLWSLPGGLVEVGETLIQAAAREVMEETGLAVQVLERADIVEVIRREGNGRVRGHYVIVSFAARWVAGEASAGDATDAVRWLAPDEIGDLAMTSGTAEVIAKAAALMR